jgi:KaiB domain
VTRQLESAEMQATYRLTLFVTPENSGTALADLYAGLRRLKYNDYELDIVDVLAHPDKARKYQIEETPTLIYHGGGPEGKDKVFTKLSDSYEIEYGLGLRELW